MSIFDENEKDDFFMNSEIPEKKEEPQKPVYKPDDPRYWEEPENEYEHLIPSRRKKWKFWLGAVAALIAIAVVWIVYLVLFGTRVEQASQYGYVEQIMKSGRVIQTYEGVILPYKNLMDSTRVYEGDFIFSTNDPGVAASLKRMQFANRPVRVIYSIYNTAMPWRGDRKVIVTRVDSVDERDILPPDRQPEYLKAVESGSEE